MLNGHEVMLGRREFLTATGGLLPLGLLHGAENDPLVESIKIHDKWNHLQLNEFLNQICDQGRLSLKIALKNLKTDAGTDALKGKSKDVEDIQRELLWASTHTALYHFHSKESINYHDLVIWVAEKFGVSKTKINHGSSFALERAIFEKALEAMWNKLSDEERRELLKDDTRVGRGPATDAAKDLLTFRKIVKSQGFKFYTTMSRVLSATAKSIGYKLPFAAYTGASRLVGLLTGPIGLAISVALVVGELAYVLGKANVEKSAAFVLQMHALKVAALLEAKIPEENIFTPSILYPGGGRIEANRNEAREWETFEIQAHSNGTISLKAYTGYLCAEQGGGGHVLFNRDRALEWEQWTLVKQADATYTLQAQSGHYLCVEPGGGKIIADRTEAREWERFAVTKSADGKTCTIQSWEGKYLSAQPE